MGNVTKHILTINCGSSSLKVDLFNLDNLELVLKASISSIGTDTASLLLNDQTYSISAKTPRQAFDQILDKTRDIFDSSSVIAIGHRLVHGGMKFDGAVMLNEVVINQLNQTIIFDPEHMPNAIKLIKDCQVKFPHIEQVACFDTAFFNDLPSQTKILPLPRQFESLGLRRYGFHGLSYESILSSFKMATNKETASGKIVIAHLGSGASLCVLKDTKPLDTTMAFTPASGVVMANRSGDLDPGIISFLNLNTGMSIGEFNHMVHFDSGLKGISGLSADMKELLELAATKDNAQDAINIFVLSVKKAIAALSAVSGGIDSLIFSGGIGEKSAVIRSAICDNLDYLGVKLNKTANETNNFLISDESSQVGVHVIASDEASVIASQTKILLGGAV